MKTSALQPPLPASRAPRGPHPRLPLLPMGLELRPGPDSTPDLCLLKTRSPNPLILFKALIKAIYCYRILLSSRISQDQQVGQL